MAETSAFRLELERGAHLARWRHQRRRGFRQVVERFVLAEPRRGHNDDQPYEIKTTTRPLVMVPYTLEINDIPMMLIQHREAHELFDRARDQFDRLYDEGRRTARVMAIAVHPYISGVPHRIKYKGEDVLDWYRSLAGRR